MLLKNGYRHVYMSRKFALKHGFIPLDAAPGHYGYSGLVKFVFLFQPVTTRADQDFFIASAAGLSLLVALEPLIQFTSLRSLTLM